MSRARRNGWVLAAAAVATGCSSSSAGPDATPVPEEKPPLVQPQSCAELGTLFRADAKGKLEARMRAMSGFLADPTTRPMFTSPAGATNPTGGGTGGAPGLGAGTGGSASTGGPAGTGGSSDGGGADVNGGSKSGDPPAHSDTTTQVSGVDEADIVKTDGTYLYALHGGSLAIVDVWPVASLALSSSTPIEGTPLEMFVTPTNVVVFSTVEAAGVLAAAGLAPKPAITDAYVSSSAFAPPKPTTPGSIGPMTKVTVLTLAGTAATVAAEHWFEGTYVSSRRVGGSVRVVIDGVAHGPIPDPTQPKSADELSAIELAGHQAIDAAKAEDFLPIAVKRVGGAMVASPPPCGEFYIPPAATGETGIVRIVELDLTTPTETTAVTVVGRADHVYGDRDTLWIAARPYLDRDVVVASAFAPGQKPESVSIDATTVHAFDFSKAGAPRYLATGKIDGRVPDQFAMDEKDGSLRIATSGQRVVLAKALAPDGTKTPIAPDPLSHLVVLSPRGTSLVQTGTAGDVAPGDTIRATRFVRDHAYLVTLRTSSPLVAIDVSDASAPTVIGSVDIPGFSEFVQPMDDTHLLTIGRDTTSTGGTSLALSIFDVADPKAPAVVQHLVYAGIDGYSAAETNQKAFTYWQDRGLLAFPYVGVQASGLGGLKSTLEVFHVDRATGFSKLGSIDHASFFKGTSGFCGGAYGLDVRRGVFIENVVFSLSYGGVVAASIDDPNTSIGTLMLPPPPCP